MRKTFAGLESFLGAVGTVRRERGNWTARRELVFTGDTPAETLVHGFVLGFLLECFRAV